ncbi:MAG: hypothetical protein AABN33_18335 [Acidobacteriota bacterium]
MEKAKKKTKAAVMTPEQFRERAKAAAEQIQQHRAAAQLAAESLAHGRAAFGPEDGTREERLDRTHDSALEFGRVYLPHYFQQEGAVFHEALDRLLTGNYSKEDLKRWTEEFGIEIHIGDPLLRLMAIQIARGHAKSVIANLCDSLRRICHGLDPYLVIAGDTFAQAGSQLEDIKDELASNEKLAADFGRLKPGRGGSWGSVELIQDTEGRVTWREGMIVTANQVRVDAIGRGGKMRGRRHGAQRPTCVKLDDLDNDENVVSKEQRDKAWNWIISAVIPALDPRRGQVQLLGTTIHFDCCIARAVRKTDGSGQRLFTSINFPAMRRVPGSAGVPPAPGEVEREEQAGRLRSQARSQGAVEDDEKPGQFWISNWPARFPVKKLLAIRRLMGAAKFGAEYMNDPRDPETQIFNIEKLTYYSPRELEGKSLKRLLYIDPSKGKKGKGRKKSDFSGMADVLIDQAARVTYIVDAYRKRLSPTAAENEILKWYPAVLKTDPTSELWIEENSFGDLLGDRFQNRLRETGVDKLVHTLLHTEEKAARLERFSIRIETAGVRFPQRWEQEDRRPEWFSEMEDYPGAYDDTIDAIESADAIGSRTVTAASGGKDPEGETSRDRARKEREERTFARMRGLGRRKAA